MPRIFRESDAARCGGGSRGEDRKERREIVPRKNGSFFTIVGDR
jgi:hypothetical protein